MGNTPHVIPVEFVLLGHPNADQMDFNLVMRGVILVYAIMILLLAWLLQISPTVKISPRVEITDAGGESKSFFVVL